MSVDKSDYINLEISSSKITDEQTTAYSGVVIAIGDNNIVISNGENNVREVVLKGTNKMFKTGDLVMFSPDGSLVTHRRLKNKVDKDKPVPEKRSAVSGSIRPTQHC